MYSIRDYQSSILRIFSNSVKLQQDPADDKAVIELANDVHHLARNINEEIEKLLDASREEIPQLIKKYTKNKSLQELLGRTLIDKQKQIRRIDDASRFNQILSSLDKIFELKISEEDLKPEFALTNDTFTRLDIKKIDPSLSLITKNLLVEAFLAFREKDRDSNDTDLVTTIAVEDSVKKLEDDPNAKKIFSSFQSSFLNLGTVQYLGLVNKLENTWHSFVENPNKSAEKHKDDLENLNSLVYSLLDAAGSFFLWDKTKLEKIALEIFNTIYDQSIESKSHLTNEDINEEQIGKDPALMLLFRTSLLLSEIPNLQTDEATKKKIIKLFTLDLSPSPKLCVAQLFSKIQIQFILGEELKDHILGLITEADYSQDLPLYATRFMINNPQMAYEKSIKVLVESLKHTDEKQHLFAKTILSSWSKNNVAKDEIRNELFLNLNKYLEREPENLDPDYLYRILRVLSPLLDSSNELIKILSDNLGRLYLEERDLFLAAIFSFKDSVDIQKQHFDFCEFIDQKPIDAIENGTWPTFVKFRLLANYKIDRLKNYLEKGSMLGNPDEELMQYFLEETKPLNLKSLIKERDNILEQLKLEALKIQTIDQALYNNKNFLPIVLKKIEMGEKEVPFIKVLFDLHRMAINAVAAKADNKGDMAVINKVFKDSLVSVGPFIIDQLIRIVSTAKYDNDSNADPILNKQRKIAQEVLKVWNNLPELGNKVSLLSPNVAESGALAV